MTIGKRPSVLLRGYDEIRRLRRARQQPELEMTCVPVAPLLDETRLRLFPMLPRRLPAFFVIRGPLACVAFNADTREGAVFVHALLNHPAVPVEVFDLICRHELLHLVIAAREINGKLIDHPPEFFEKERAITPDRDAAWEWVWGHCWEVLRQDKKRESMVVKRGWRHQGRWWSADAGADSIVTTPPVTPRSF